jgi:glucans biosynthesis protein C
MNAVASTGAAIGTRPGARLFFIDNLRWLVIVMVVVMHVCVTYSGLGSWYYKEPARLGIASGLIFTFYESTAQAFFMGLLFLVAGTFVPAAYDRKGLGKFLKDRLVRLGIPTLLFMLILDPLTSLIMALLRGDAVSLAAVAAGYGGFLASFRFLSATGPLWFALALLVFSVIYALARRTVQLVRGARPAPAPRQAAAVTHGKVAAAAAVIAVGSFLVRLVQPVGTSVLNMQLCYFTQYIVLFLVGLWAARSGFLRTVPYRFAMSWFRIALAAGIPAWFIIGGLGGALSGSAEAFGGGLSWQSAAYAAWESFFCVGICLGLVVIYRERVTTRSTVSGFLSDNAFGVYCFHTPLLVTISLLLRQLSLAPLAKAVVVGVLALGASFLFAALVRRVPGLRKIFS